jgi:hypothetical protein
MANYNPMIRTSYFKPRDAEAFEHFCRRYGLVKIEDTQGGEKLVGFYVDNGEGIPTYVCVEETDECEEVDPGAFLDELARHLAPEWAVEVREIGFEKMRYLVGVSTVVRWDGETHTLSLDEIEERVRKEWGDEFHLTTCAY